MKRTIISIALATVALVGSGFAGTGYPVSGKWTYDRATAPGPAPDCSGPRYMKFDGNTRYDTGGGIREFKNTRTVQTGAGLYRVVDTFYNGQTWGNVIYALRVADADHVQIDYAKGGHFALRRCA
jgi:hypothetical protein